MIVAAIVLGSVAGALLDDTLVGVDCSDGTVCYGNTGWLLMKMAFAMMGNGVLILGTTVLRMKMGEEFSLGEWLANRRMFIERWFLKGDLVSIIATILTVLSVIGLILGMALLGTTSGAWFALVSAEVFCIAILLRLSVYADQHGDSDDNGGKTLKLFQEGWLCVGMFILCTGIITLSAGLASLDGNIGDAREFYSAGALFTILGVRFQ